MGLSQDISVCLAGVHLDALETLPQTGLISGLGRSGGVNLQSIPGTVALLAALPPLHSRWKAQSSVHCKSSKGWEAFKNLNFKLNELSESDVLSDSELTEKKEDDKSLNEAGSQIEAQTGIMDVKKEEWEAISSYFKKLGYPDYHKNISLPAKCANIYRGGSLPSDKQSKEASIVRKQAYNEGFDFIA